MRRYIDLNHLEGLPYFIFKFPYNQVVKEVLKDTFKGSRFDKDTKTWRCPASGDNLQELVPFMHRYEFSLTDSANEFMQDPEAEETVLREMSAQKEPTENPPIEALLPYQAVGVEYAYKARKTFIADEMGLGKTLQAIATTEKAGAYPALVVCPASLKYNWEREWDKWAPGHSIAIWDSDNQKSADVIIVNYAMLTKLKLYLKAHTFRIAIFDESHYLKSGNSQRTKTAKALAKNIPRVLLLTGTPITSRPKDYISQLQVINRLDYLGGFYKFVTRYCEGKRTHFGWDINGASNLGELNRKLRGTCYIRRNKKDVLPELPAKRRVVVPYLPDLKKYKAHKQDLEKEYGVYLNERTLKEVLEKLTEQNSALLDLGESLVKKNAKDKIKKYKLGVQIQDIEDLKQLVLESKKEFVISWIKDFLESGEKLVVFGIHRAWLQDLAKTFDAPLLIGGMSDKKKDEAVQQFQNDPDCSVIFLNIQSGGTGLTLTESSNVAFTELAWTPAAHDQAEDRVHRIGQEASSVTAWYLLAENTIEEDIFKLILGKRQVSTEATEGYEDYTVNRIIEEAI